MQLQKIFLKDHFGNHFKRIFSVVLTSSRRCNSTDHEPPRNLFEVYQKNSHWMNVYKRHEVLKDKIQLGELEQKITTEHRRLSPVELQHYIESNRTEWTPNSRRVGAIGIKLGTSVLWTKEGFRHACTVIQVNNNLVLISQKNVYN